MFFMLQIKIYNIAAVLSSTKKALQKKSLDAPSAPRATPPVPLFAAPVPSRLASPPVVEERGSVSSTGLLSS
jgi:hypothetical protein